MDLRALGNWLIIDPLYDPEKIGSIIIPNAYRNNYPHQGDIVSCGLNSPFKPGMRVVLRSFVVEPLKAGDRLLAIRDIDCVARIEGKELHPKPMQVLVLPDWSEKYSQPSKTIIISDVELDDGSAITRGTVTRIGEKVTSVKAGDYVLFPPDKGTEVGYIDTNFYIFDEDELLATLTRA